jgi:carbon-monoxide dehydrogenase large subunit
VKRREDLPLIHGGGRFLDDLHLPDALVLAVVRSPHGHARIRRIALPSSPPRLVAFLTASDLGPANRPLPAMVFTPGVAYQAMPRPLAESKVRCVGEAVAAVLAEDPGAAEDAIHDVVVEYDLLPAVTDPEEALAPQAPVLHEEHGSNVLGSWRVRVGDAEAAFARADLVVSARLSVARAAASPIETRGALAVPDPLEDRLTLWSTTQVPHALRLWLAEFLGHPDDPIRVVCPDVGGAFGSKLILYPEEALCALLALRFRRPVKWVERRGEHFAATGHARDQVHQAELALTRDGAILALRDRFYHDSGAYAPYALRLPLVTAACLTGPYRVPHLDAAFTAVYTNKAPVIPYRGAGQPEAVFVLERLLDRAARRLGLDPVEVRRRNLLPASAFPYKTGIAVPGMGAMVYDNGSARAALEALAERLGLEAVRRAPDGSSDPARRSGNAVMPRPDPGPARRIGVGVACYQEATAAGSYEGATVWVDTRGEVHVASGVPSQGQGHETMLAALAAEILAVPPERVRVRLGDTAAVPFGVGTWGSRSAAVAAPAVVEAATEVKARATQIAARLLAASPEDIRLQDGYAVVAGAPERRLALGDLARAAASGRGAMAAPEPGLQATRYFLPKGLTYASGAHGAVVEVDLEIRMVRVVRYVVVHDCGRLLDPAIVTGQIVGGVVQGIGTALGERIVYDGEGQLLTATFTDYPLPRAADVPSIEVYHLETPSRANPLGVRGAGEGGIIPVAAAIASAVEDALAGGGVTIDSVPITPAVLHEHLQGYPRFQSSARRGSARSRRLSPR